jgi:beta-carotene 3-hydroxylase
MNALLLVISAFAGMEVVSYATHRWVMHGFAFAWHRSHHQPPAGRFERNDLFPLLFSVVGVILFVLATTVPALGPLFWLGVGVAGYGAAYLLVHEICIHRRLHISLGRGRYFEWLRDAHRVHHRVGGEPYGMLLPVVTRSRSEANGPVDPAAPDERDASALDRSTWSRA